MEAQVLPLRHQITVQAVAAAHRQLVALAQAQSLEMAALVRHLMALRMLVAVEEVYIMAAL
jgi:hypothetical protein